MSLEKQTRFRCQPNTFTARNYTIRSTTVARADFLTGVLLRVCTETSHYAHTAYYSYNHTQTTIMALFLELPAPCGSWVCKWVSVYVSK